MVSESQDTPVASLRYFKADGPFAELLRAQFALELPAPGRATHVTIAGEEAIAVWRSPTETLVVSAPLAPLQQRLAGTADGCCIDQTGGIVIARVSGNRVPDLLLRLGGTASVPALGEARATRLAEIPALATRVDANETLLLVERVYADHLFKWMRSVADDLNA